MIARSFVFIHRAVAFSLIAIGTSGSVPNATFVVIPGVGHFVVPKSACAQLVMESFLTNPEAPDIGCVAALKPPPFSITPR